MILELTNEQALELQTMLRMTIEEHRHQLDTTDDVRRREALLRPLQLLEEIAAEMETKFRGSTISAGAPSSALFQELARPGD